MGCMHLMIHLILKFHTSNDKVVMLETYFRSISHLFFVALLEKYQSPKELETNESVTKRPLEMYVLLDKQPLKDGEDGEETMPLEEGKKG